MKRPPGFGAAYLAWAGPRAYLGHIEDATRLGLAPAHRHAREALPAADAWNRPFMWPQSSDAYGRVSCGEGGRLTPRARRQ